MRCLFFHVKEYFAKVTTLANRPEGIKPEPVTEESQHVQNAIVAFVTVESGDQIDWAKRCIKDILKFVEETGEKNIVIAPFAHLSSHLATSDEALSVLQAIEDGLKKQDIIRVVRSHFGSDKELLIHLFGHKGNARFREYID